MNSILQSIKKLLGIQLEYDHFDADIIMGINTALSTLTQVGVGPKHGFTVTGYDETWEDFLGDDPRLAMVKSYVQLKVKMLFDSSSMTASVIDAMNSILAETEWRLTVLSDEKRKES